LERKIEKENSAVRKRGIEHHPRLEGKGEKKNREGVTGRRDGKKKGNKKTFVKKRSNICQKEKKRLKHSQVEGGAKKIQF